MYGTVCLLCGCAADVRSREQQGTDKEIGRGSYLRTGKAWQNEWVNILP